MRRNDLRTAVLLVIDNWRHGRANYRIRQGIASVRASMSNHRVSYTLESTLETVNSAEEAASRIAADAGFGDDAVMKISMAVREAAVNAVLHGNAYDPS